MNRLVTWRYELAIIAARFLDENSAWPHLWPSTASDYVETVLTRASESTVFGLKSTKKSTKVVKKRWRICSGRRSRKFESCHLDHKKQASLADACFLCHGCVVELGCEATQVRLPRAGRVELARKLQAAVTSPTAKILSVPCGCLFFMSWSLFNLVAEQRKCAYPAQDASSSLVSSKPSNFANGENLVSPLWLPFWFFFVYSTAFFKGWRLFSSALAFYYQLNKLEFSERIWRSYTKSKYVMVQIVLM